MRIVDRKTFLAMPAGTLYAKFGDEHGTPNHFYFGEVRIKAEGRGETDWWSVGFTDNFVDAHDSGAWSDKLFDAVESGSEIDLEFDTLDSDGLYDDAQLFAVFSRHDAVGMIRRLSQALEDGYGANIAYIRDPAHPTEPPEAVTLPA